MATIDLKQQLKQLYAPATKAAALVDVPPLDFVMLDGRGDPNTAPEYTLAVETLYALAYALKFKLKRGALGLDYVVMPLEGLWWAEQLPTIGAAIDPADKASWQWTMMIMQPPEVTLELFEQALSELRAKKPALALDRLRFERYHEGRAAQIMHIGAYADEMPTIARLHAFIKQQNLTMHRKHHEIYLGDPRKSAPAKLRTVIRQPVE